MTAGTTAIRNDTINGQMTRTPTGKALTANMVIKDHRLGLMDGALDRGHNKEKDNGLLESAGDHRLLAEDRREDGNEFSHYPQDQMDQSPVYYTS